jgi:DNA repair protein RadC
MKRIADLPKLDRPREKLQAKGAEALSDLELLAILLGSGIEGHDVMTVAGQLLKFLDKNEKYSLKDLQEIEGVGPVKATLIAAALEFARRRIRPEGVKIKHPADVLPLISYLADRKQEHFIGISLNGANEVIASRVITVGLVNATQIHPREVFADPISDRACALIIAHNHPSGSLVPSQEDIAITKRLKAAGETVGIRLMDHIIFNQKGYYSLMEHGELQPL